MKQTQSAPENEVNSATTRLTCIRTLLRNRQIITQFSSRWLFLLLPGECQTIYKVWSWLL